MYIRNTEGKHHHEILAYQYSCRKKYELVQQDEPRIFNNKIRDRRRMFLSEGKTTAVLLQVSKLSSTKNEGKMQNTKTSNSS